MDNGGGIFRFGDQINLGVKLVEGSKQERVMKYQGKISVRKQLEMDVVLLVRLGYSSRDLVINDQVLRGYVRVREDLSFQGIQVREFR